MAETDRPRVTHDDVEHAIATFRRNLLESVKTGKWMAACWKMNEKGEVELVGCTTWQWEDSQLEVANSALKKEILERLGPAETEDDPLPMADFMREIKAVAKQREEEKKK
jgi:hypothetical protein